MSTLKSAVDLMSLTPRWKPPVNIHLVRHATAFVRTASADDIMRPLDPNGQQQAARIAQQLQRHPIVRILSSPATRCEETMLPLAQIRRLPVEIHDALWEGHVDRRALDLVLGLAQAGPALHGNIALQGDIAPHGDIALCSHGDIIPSIIDGLIAQGMVTRGNIGVAKGSVWTLHVENGLITSGSYTPTNVSVNS